VQTEAERLHTEQGAAGMPGFSRYALRQTVASHGCRSRGRPGGR
jgi:hypothetical protein